MKILISGATGLVGTALTRELVRRGHQVNYLSTSRGFPESMGVASGFYWNPSKEVLDDAALEGCQAVVHLAGANLNHRWTESYKRKIIESRVLSAKLLFDRIQQMETKPAQFVSASGIAIYPDSLTQVFTEKDLEKDHSFLSQVVQKWEAAADRFASLGLKVCKVRTGPVLSDQGGLLKEVEAPVKFGLGSAFGSGKQWQSWIHLDDLVSLYVAALENSWEGVYNGTAPIAVTNQAMMQAIAKRYARPILLPKVPKFALKLILGEMHQMLLSSQHVLPQQPMDNGFKFRYPTLDEALDHLIRK